MTYVELVEVNKRKTMRYCMHQQINANWTSPALPNGKAGATGVALFSKATEPGLRLIA